MSLKLVRVARLKQLQAELNIVGTVELGKVIGRKANQTGDLLAGRVSFGEKIARSIEDFAALPPGWLDLPIDSRDGYDVAGWDAATVSGGLSIQVGPLVSGTPPAAEAHAGIVGRLLLSPRWVARSVELVHGPKDLRFLHVADDSMEPTMGKGDLLLVDSGMTRCDRDCVCVLRVSERISIKRIRQRMDGAYDVSSDSPNVKSVDVLTAAQLQLVGRVVWIWRGSAA
jgi:hypothetical protein